MKRARRLVLLACLAGCATPDRMLDDVRTLAAVDMLGRAEETGGAARAADWIEKRFRDLGLETARVPYSIPRRRVLDGTRFEFAGGALAPGAEFAPLVHSASAEATGPLAKAGAADVRGAIVVETVGPAPGIFRTLDPPLAERALGYQERGAAGVVFVADAEDPEAGGEAAWAFRLSAYRAASLAKEPAEIRGWLAERSAVGEQSRAPLPSTPLRIPAALASARSFDAALGQPARLKVALDDTPLSGDDVLATLPGNSDAPAVLLSAHYDSHGRRPDGRLFPGACDNASGVAVLLAVAEALSDERLARPVVFAAFGGEELGLHGSRAYAASPHPPLLCDLNVDMAARGPESEMYVVGSAFAPDVAEIAKRALEHAGFAVKSNIDFTFRFGSDHWSLHQAGIPSILFTCGRSPKIFPECDMPGDAVELCSAAKMRRVAEAVEAAVREAAGRAEAFARPVEAVVKFPGEK